MSDPTDLRTEKVQKICKDNIGDMGSGCSSCPLSRPCQMMARDTRESFAERMNAAAEEIGESNG